MFDVRASEMRLATHEIIENLLKADTCSDCQRVVEE